MNPIAGIFLSLGAFISGLCIGLFVGIGVRNMLQEGRCCDREKDDRLEIIVGPVSEQEKPHE